MTFAVGILLSLLNVCFFTVRVVKKEDPTILGICVFLGIFAFFAFGPDIGIMLLAGNVTAIGLYLYLVLLGIYLSPRPRRR